MSPEEMLDYLFSHPGEWIRFKDVANSDAIHWFRAPKGEGTGGGNFDGSLVYHRMSPSHPYEGITQDIIINRGTEYGSDWRLAPE